MNMRNVIHTIFLIFSLSSILRSENSEKYLDAIIDLDDFLIYSGPKLDELSKNAADAKVEYYFTRLDDLTKELEFTFPEINPNPPPKVKIRYENSVDFIETTNRRWHVAKGAREFLDSLDDLEKSAKKHGRKLRISFFSARKDAKERNEAVVKNLKLSDGRSAWDLADGRMYSDNDMETKKDTNRRLKDIRKLLSGVESNHVIFFDDKVKYIPDALQDGLIWAYHQDRNQRLAHARGILDSAINAWDNGEVTSIVAGLKKTQWSENKGEQTYIDTVTQSPQILKTGIKILEKRNKNLFPSAETPDWENETGPPKETPHEIRKTELKEADKPTFSYSGYSSDSSWSWSSNSKSGSKKEEKPIVDTFDLKQLANIVNKILIKFPNEKYFYLFRDEKSLYLAAAFEALLPLETDYMGIANYTGSISEGDVKYRKPYIDELNKNWPSKTQLGKKVPLIINYSPKGDGIVDFIKDIHAYLKFENRDIPVEFLTMVENKLTARIESDIKEQKSKLSVMEIFPNFALLKLMEQQSRKIRTQADYDPTTGVFIDEKAEINYQNYVLVRKQFDQFVATSPEFRKEFTKLVPSLEFKEEKASKSHECSPSIFRKIYNAFNSDWQN